MATTSMFESAAKARDRALEGAVFSFLYGLAGDYIELEREGVQFDFSKGLVKFAKMEFKNAIKDIVNQQLAAQLGGGKNKLKLTSGCLHEIEMTDFYPQDVLDGDFDYPISARVNGLVLVLEPCTEEEEEADGSSTSTEQEPVAAEAAEPSAAAATEEEEGTTKESNMLLETFLQGFGHIEITKVHIRYQDPLKKINIALNIGCGDYGSIKLWEPTKGEVGPKSFRSVDKENEGKPKPLQDVVKQFFFPFPSIEINDKADTMINGSTYNFEPQTNQQCAVIQEGSLFTCSIALDSRNLGQDITIFDPQLRDPLVFNLNRDQIKTVLDVAKFLKPKEMTENPDILVGADILDNFGITLTQKQLQHFFLDKQTAEALPEDAPGFFVDRNARIKINPNAAHTEASFQSASSKPIHKYNTTTEDQANHKTATSTAPPTSPPTTTPVSMDTATSDIEVEMTTPKTPTPKKKKSLWGRMKKTLSCKGGGGSSKLSEDVVLAVSIDGSSIGTSTHSAADVEDDDDATNYTHALGDHAAAIPIQLEQSWGGSFNGLEITNVGRVGSCTSTSLWSSSFY